MKRVALLSMLFVPATMMLGCIIQPTEDSCNIKTPGIFTEYNVSRSGNDVLVQAKFWVGNRPGGTVLNFGQCKDRIEVNGKVLTEVGNSYEAKLQQAEEYVFTFIREGEDPYVSRISLPPAVNITAPAAGETITRDKGFDIAWDNNNAGGNLNLEVDGDCIRPYPSVNGEEKPDNGVHSVPPNGIEATETGKDKTCEATIELTRTSGGELDSRLKGSIKAETSASMKFNSAPAPTSSGPEKPQQ